MHQILKVFIVRVITQTLIYSEIFYFKILHEFQNTTMLYCKRYDFKCKLLLNDEKVKNNLSEKELLGTYDNYILQY